jgi:hypothetical protein
MASSLQKRKISEQVVVLDNPPVFQAQGENLRDVCLES